MQWTAFINLYILKDDIGYTYKDIGDRNYIAENVLKYSIIIYGIVVTKRH